MKIKTSTGEAITLTDDQARILLRVIQTEESCGHPLTLVCESGCSSPRRETATAEALVRKKLLTRIRKQKPQKTLEGRIFSFSDYGATLEGYWQGDALRAHFREQRARANG